MSAVMEERPALEDESYILGLFEEQNFTNPKKLKKFATRLYKEAQTEVQQWLIMDILTAADPIKYLNDAIAKIRDCAVIIEQFIEDGCHGMIMMGNNVYPVKLETVQKWLIEQKPWDPEQEMLIQHDAANSWMREHDKGRFSGKVVLFPQFGFSGIPRDITMACTEDVEGLVKYEGTDYYIDPVAEKLAALSHELRIR